MSNPIYTAKAHIEGGRTAGHGSGATGLAVDLRLPAEMGGDGAAGTNPEELFAIGYAACFEGALGAAARREKVELEDVAIDAAVSLLPTPERSFQLAVTLDVTMGNENAAELVKAAHKICPYSNATRGNVEVTLTANGEPVT